jgi:hypothetical protein
LKCGSQCHKLLTRKFSTMKLLKIIIINLGAIAISSFYTSCNKETPKTAATQSDFSNSALVQVFSATITAAGNKIYVDGNPVSGAAVGYGGVYPGTAFAFELSPGARSFLIKDTLDTTHQVPLTFSQNLSAGKSYTIFTYDTITSPKQVTVLNNIEIPSDTTCRLRFANFIYSTASLPNVDVYSFNSGTTSPVFSNVPTDSVTNFIPYAAGLSDTLYVYATGTTSPLIVKKLVPGLVQTRSYTSACTGRFRGTKTISTFATY